MGFLVISRVAWWIVLAMSSSYIMEQMIYQATQMLKDIASRIMSLRRSANNEYNQIYISGLTVKNKKWINGMKNICKVKSKWQAEAGEVKQLSKKEDKSNLNPFVSWSKDLSRKNWSVVTLIFVCFPKLKLKKFFKILNLKLEDTYFSVRTDINVETWSCFILTKIFLVEN